MEIDDLRAEVDRIDAEMLKLMDQRVHFADEISAAKSRKGLPPQDKAREADMRRAAESGDYDHLSENEAVEFVDALLGITREWLTRRGQVARVKPLKITIVGLGLIGGSVAKALKRAQPLHTLNGVDLAERLVAPRSSGLFDQLAEPEQGADAVSDADVVFLCVPPSKALELLGEIASDAPDGAIVTDVSGLKAPIVNKAAEVFWGETDFVGGHPMAGKASSGFENADARLFEAKPWVLTPKAHDPVERLARLQALIESTGANVQLINPREHDRTMAVVSHMPQFASVAVSLAVGGRDRGLAGGGLMDMTRLASSPPQMWNELVSMSRQPLIGELQRLRAYLTELEIAVTFGEPLDRLFNRAASLRQRLESSVVAKSPEDA